MANITFYELPGCPFCTRVRATLDELDLEFDTVEVPAAHHERTEVEAVSGQTGVPVIVDESNDVTGLTESDAIVRYLEETYGS